MPAATDITETGISYSPAAQRATVPPGHAALVTPSDSADLTYATRGISFATAGALKVTMVGGEEVVIPSGALAAGVIHPMRVTRVWSTGTGALNIVAWW